MYCSVLEVVENLGCKLKPLDSCIARHTASAHETGRGPVPPGLSSNVLLLLDELDVFLDKSRWLKVSLTHFATFRPSPMSDYLQPPARAEA